MTDMYHRHADAVADALLADPDLFADLEPAAGEPSGDHGPVTPLSDTGRVDPLVAAPNGETTVRGPRPTPRTLLAAAVVVLVSVVAVAVSWPRGDSPSDTPAAASSDVTSTLGVSQADAPPVDAQAPVTPPADATGDAPVVLASATARCEPGSTDPIAAFDDDPATAWRCFPAYGVPGTVLRVRFDAPHLVTRLSMVPGWDFVDSDGTDRWTRHRTVGVVEYQFDDPDETRLRQEMAGYRGEVVTPVSPPVLAGAMTVTITGFGAPTDGTATRPDDVAIPTITISGRRP